MSTRSIYIGTRRATRIVSAVADETGVALDAILGDSRAKRIAAARKLAYARLREAGASYPRIGRLMQRDHSTVIHGIKTL